MYKTKLLKRDISQIDKLNKEIEEYEALGYVADQIQFIPFNSKVTVVAVMQRDYTPGLN